MHNCKIVSTPFPEKCALSKDDQSEDGSGDVSKIAGCDYRGLVGSISYLAMTTRPDLEFAAHLLSRFLNNPSLVHWQAAKRQFAPRLMSYNDFKKQSKPENGFDITAAMANFKPASVDPERSFSYELISKNWLQNRLPIMTEMCS